MFIIILPRSNNISNLCHFFLTLFVLFTLWPLSRAYAELSDPYRIMEDHYKAIGGLERLKQIKTSYSEGKTRLDGLTGNFKQWEKRPLKYRTEENYTTISQTLGDTGQISWLLDTNGQLLLYKDDDTLKRREIGRRLDSYEHLQPDSPNFQLTFGKVSNILGHQCYEVILSNTINSDITTFYIDMTSFLIVQSIHKQPDMELITRYGDYRKIEGTIIPFYEHTLILPWEKEEEAQTTRYIINDPIPDSLFSLPEKNRDFTFLSKKTSSTVPFLFSENLIYLPVEFNGSQRYWVLDSGASMSVIDADYAKQLNLTIKENIKGYGFGDLFELSFVDVPAYRVGDITFKSQTFFALNNLASRSYDPEIAGILGYDFLSRFIVEIDYANESVAFYDPAEYRYNGDGIIINAPLKYRTFTVPVILDKQYKGKWTIDLGAHNSSIHYPFALKNNLTQKKGIETVSQGIGGISFEKTVQFSHLEIVGFQLEQPLITIPLEPGKGTTSLGEVAGNLGNSILRHFHLTLNYPDQEIILAKGINFDQIFPTDKSGMLIGRSEINQPVISFVANESPAQKAGFIAGDIILEVDGKKTPPNHQIIPLRDLLRGDAGSRHIFSLSREGKKLTISLKLQDLFP